MGHKHHHHVDPESGDTRVAFAVAINLALTVAQVIGGIISGSLSLIADALHNFSDAIALIIAFAARKIARRPSDAQMTFGYGRIEAVAALVNYTTLIVIGLYLVYEAILRFIDPSPVTGWIIVIVAGAALLIDLATAALTYTMSKTSVNMRAAFLHNLADALGSVAVIIAGTLVLLYGWLWVDPAVTVLIAGYILWQSFSELPGVVRILMLGSPPDMDAAAVIETIAQVPGVVSVHHVHLWMMGEHDPALDAHVVLEPGSDGPRIRGEIKKRLETEHHLHHTTLEIEHPSDQCNDSPMIGH